MSYPNQTRLVTVTITDIAEVVKGQDLAVTVHSLYLFLLMRFVFCNSAAKIVKKMMIFPTFAGLKQCTITTWAEYSFLYTGS